MIDSIIFVVIIFVVVFILLLEMVEVDFLVGKVLLVVVK